MLNASTVANSIVEPIYSKQIEEIEKMIVKEAKKGFVNCHYFNGREQKSPASIGGEMNARYFL